MARRNPLASSRAEIMRWFDGAKPHVYTARGLQTIFATQRDQWKLPAKLTANRFIDFLLEETPLEEARLKVDLGGEIVRYCWGKASVFELALSLRGRAYLSHGTAVFLHALTDELPKVIYLNIEQRPKPAKPGTLRQESVDLAFSRPQRTSKNVVRAGDARIILLNGKFTGRLEVGQAEGPDGEVLETTKLERTLIDITVRPAYAGGIHKVLDAYRGARDRVSTNTLAAVLQKLDYVYPYHQAIGFLLERAEYPPARLDPLRRFERSVDFYLAHGLRQKEYDPNWRLFFPKGM